MFRKILFVLFVAILVTSAGELDAYQDFSPQHSDRAWQVSFWNNMSLSGDPILRQTHDDIDFNWGSGSPNGAVSTDRFSVRWERYIDFDRGTYRFFARSDDGIRVYVDNVLILNQWNDHPVQHYSADRDLSQGHHLVVVEYYEHIGLAEIGLEIFPVSTIDNYWRAEYFTNRNLTGEPVLERRDQVVYFNWFDGSPASGIPADNFSVRWTRTLRFEPGEYKFMTGVDDGVRLWVGGHLIIDQWQDQAASDFSGTIYLSGDVFVKMEYYEHTGQAVAQLTWAPADYPQTPKPPSSGIVVTVDDGDAGFVRGGSSRAWRSVSEGHNGDLTWTWNNDIRRANYNWARWYPSLGEGRYEVFVFIPDRYTTTEFARYWISHEDGYTVQVVDQSRNGNRWVSLGTYDFLGTQNDYVSLSDITFEPYVSRLIAFDAVRWVSR